jgi:hypothetical protein
MFETVCKRQTMKEISTTNQFLIEMAKTIQEGDSEEQMHRLEWIENEVRCWCCDDDEGAEQLIRAVRFMLEQW